MMVALGYAVGSFLMGKSEVRGSRRVADSVRH